MQQNDVRQVKHLTACPFFIIRLSWGSAGEESTFALRGAGASAVGKYDSLLSASRNSLGMG
jgi:hypothetical protein